jgi:hypothetical protein
VAALTGIVREGAGAKNDVSAVGFLGTPGATAMGLAIEAGGFALLPGAEGSDLAFFVAVLTIVSCQ